MSCYFYSCSEQTRGTTEVALAYFGLKAPGRKYLKMKQTERETMKVMVKAKVLCCLGSVSFLMETDACTYQEELPLDKKLKTTLGTVKHPSSC